MVQMCWRDSLWWARSLPHKRVIENSDRSELSPIASMSYNAGDIRKCYSRLA
jgi:hypothetical protein